MLRGDGGERHAKRHLAPKCGPVRKSVEFGPVELDGLLPRYASGWIIKEICWIFVTKELYSPSYRLPLTYLCVAVSDHIIQCVSVHEIPSTLAHVIIIQKSIHLEAYRHNKKQTIYVIFFFPTMIIVRAGNIAFVAFLATTTITTNAIATRSRTVSSFSQSGPRGSALS